MYCSHPELSDEALHSNKYRDGHPDALVESGDEEPQPKPSSRRHVGGEAAFMPKSGARKRTTVEHYSPGSTKYPSTVKVKPPPSKKPKRKQHDDGDDEDTAGEELVWPDSTKRPPKKAAREGLSADKQMLAVTSSIANQLDSIFERLIALEHSSAAYSPLADGHAAPPPKSSKLKATPALNFASSSSSSVMDDFLLGVINDQVELQRLQGEANGRRRSERARQMGAVIRARNAGCL